MEGCEVLVSASPSVSKCRAVLVGRDSKWMPAEEGRSLGVGVDGRGTRQGHISTTDALSKRQTC